MAFVFEDLISFTVHSIQRWRYIESKQYFLTGGPKSIFRKTLITTSAPRYSEWSLAIVTCLLFITNCGASGELRSWLACRSKTNNYVILYCIILYSIVLYYTQKKFSLQLTKSNISLLSANVSGCLMDPLAAQSVDGQLQTQIRVGLQDTCSILLNT